MFSEDKVRPEIANTLQQFSFKEVSILVLFRMLHWNNIYKDFPGSLWNEYTTYTKKNCVHWKRISTNHKLYVESMYTKNQLVYTDY